MGVVVCDRSLDSVFPEDLVPSLFRALWTAWECVPAFPGTAHEDAITRPLVVRMRLSARRCGLPVIVDSQYELLDVDGRIAGRIDIRINARQPDNVYFSFECKRLNVPYPSGPRSDADKYCEKGMMRYVMEQYALCLGRGGMIGYVMDGECSAAIAAVERAIAGRRQVLRLRHKAPLLASALAETHRDVRESRHKTVTGRGFVIHHAFLPVRSTCIE